MSKFLFIAIVSHFICFTTAAQKIRTEEVDYHYNRLPSVPLEKRIRNYSVKLVPAFEEKNKQLEAEYHAAVAEANEKYKNDMTAYAVDLKAAEERYEKEMLEYNKKSTGQKIVEKSVLGETTKPVKQLPSKPYLVTVPKPVMQRTYDYSVLADTYLNLEGYTNHSAEAIQIIVTLYGFDHTQPRVLSVQKDKMTISKTPTTYKQTYYYTEFSYRHPMSVKVIDPRGKELLSVTPSQLNVYKIYRTPEQETAPSVNPELLVATLGEKTLQENLRIINDLVNDKFGFSKVPRKASLNYVKAKGDEYSDLATALNHASSGLRLLENDQNAGREALGKAIDIWNQALKESNPGNKKARIDADVTVAIYLNLLESYFAISDEVSGTAVIGKLNALDLSRTDRKAKEDYEVLFADLKKRKAVNQN